MANKFMRGALVEFVPTFGIPVPNVIVFQFNPETMTHAWTAAEAAPAGAPGARANPLATKGNPGESFTLSIVMDAAEPVADHDAVAGPIATVSGVYTRLAALELLQFPVPADPAGGLLGSVSASVGAGGVSLGGAAGGAPQRPVPESQVPTVLFVWGPGRILPVRVTSLSITETLYDALLSPTHAEASLTLRVLTPDELAWVTGPLGVVARAGYDYSLGLRRVLAAANLGNSFDSIVGMLPV